MMFRNNGQNGDVDDGINGDVLWAMENRNVRYKVTVKQTKEWEVVIWEKGRKDSRRSLATR